MTITLAIDAMGGDDGVNVVIPGSAVALGNRAGRDLSFLFFGNQEKIFAELAKYPHLSSCSKVIHSDLVITSETKPTAAIRMGRMSNLGMAIDAVSKGQADAVVSAGNTGAYMSLCKVILKTFPNIDRPALPAIIPTITGKSIVLDTGANVSCMANNLVQFALMGEAFASQILGVEKPRIGLLNVGSEEIKGNATVKEAYHLLSAFDNFTGFVEGDDITSGKVDVIVTDGFSGNIALKSIEGTARFIGSVFTEILSESFLGKIGYFVARSSFRKLKKRMDPRLYNGAVFLGLRHLAVKSHGGTDALGFANTVQMAVEMVQKNLVDKTEQRLKLMAEKIVQSSRLG